MYVNLHAHSIFSTLDGHTLLEDYARRAVALGHPAITLTDHGVMSGIPDLWKVAREYGLKPIAGIEAYVCRGSMHDKTPENGKTYHLTLLAQGEVGYKNLVTLTSKAFTEGFYRRSRIDHELLARYSEGIICLSGCLGSPLAQAIVTDDVAWRDWLIDFYLSVFGDRFYLELMNHGPFITEQQKVNRILVEIARTYEIPCVATNDLHYCESRDAWAQRKLVEITRSSQIGGSPYNYLRSNEEMVAAFGDNNLLRNSLRIAEMIETYELGSKVPKLPLSPIIPAGMDPAIVCETLVMQGLLDRLNLTGPPLPETYRVRMEYELDIVRQMGEQLGAPFEEYLLIIADLARFARQEQIPFGPRGSAAGSLLCWALGISDLDPIVNDLYFERFLNPDRVELPDIDLDFADDRRDEVFAYLQRAYGEDRVARIGNYGVIGAKKAIRDGALIVARQLSRPYLDLGSELSALVPHDPNPGSVKLADLLRDPNGPFAHVRHKKDYKLILETALQIEGRIRNTGIHASGVVVADQPLINLVPLMKTSSTSLIPIQTQYEGTRLEQLGLLKLDVLGLSEHAKMGRALDLIQDRRGTRPDLTQLPLDDQQAWEVIRSGDTLGLFQLSSRGMTAALVKLQPQNIDELAMLMAMYRPGPMDHINDICDRKHGRAPVESIHPDLDEILAPTYGIPVYQEQLIAIVVKIGGYTRGQADLLRKAMGKKDQALMAKEKQNFAERARMNGYSDADIHTIWTFIEPFANYGFNKAHSYCYAHLGYQSAYLKAHFPQEFYAASLTTEARGGNKEGETNQHRIGAFAVEAARRGVPIYPPSLEHPVKDFTPEGPGVRFGLSAIKQIGPAAIKAILKHGPFTDSKDLIIKTLDDQRLTWTHFETLAKVGAMPWAERAQALAELDVLLTLKARRGTYVRKSETASQAKARHRENLLAKLEAAVLPTDISPMEDLARLQIDIEYLGVVTGEFPLVPDVETTDQLAYMGEYLGQQVSVIGIVGQLLVRTNRRHQEMAEFRLLDQGGALDCFCWPNVWANFSTWLNVGQLVCVQGVIRLKREADLPDNGEDPPPALVQLTVSNAFPVAPMADQAAPDEARQHQMRLPDLSYDDIFPIMQDITRIEGQYAGDYRVTLTYKGVEHNVHLNPMGLFALDQRLRVVYTTPPAQDGTYRA